MKALSFVVAIILVACDVSLESENTSTQFWKQVGVRLAETGEISAALAEEAIALKISGDNLTFVKPSGEQCTGKISDTFFSLDTCYFISPHWEIVERTENKMYIYPRLGAMCYSDLVMERVQEPCYLACHLKPETGPCKALIPGYYFDQEKKKCEEFKWGGCYGVVPFKTMNECETCKCRSTGE